MAGMTLPMYQTLRDLLEDILAEKKAIHAEMTERMEKELMPELKSTREAVERIDKKLVGVKSGEKATKADKAGKGKGK